LPEIFEVVNHDCVDFSYNIVSSGVGLRILMEFDTLMSRFNKDVAIEMFDKKDVTKLTFTSMN
jgi:hypothetical protein